VFSKEVLNLLGQVITSWQVLVVTLGFIFYVNIVTYVARDRYRPPKAQKTRVRKNKVKMPPAAGPEEAEAGSSTNDELGLEEM
jgi:hypothetical protein